MDASDFPKHAAGLVLEHNPHLTSYATVERYTDDLDDDEWVSAEQRQKAIEAGCLWTLTWFPNTPVGSHSLSAADLDVLLAAAKEGER